MLADLVDDAVRDLSRSGFLCGDQESLRGEEADALTGFPAKLLLNLRARTYGLSAEF
jgi:hypothetical protein